MKIGRALLFIAACMLLYYSTAMLLFVPRATEDLYFSRGRILYGVLPLLASVVLIVLAGRSSAKSRGLRSSWGAVMKLLAYAISTVAVFDVAGMIISGLLRR